MFNKKDIDSYRSISAPDELQERVMKLSEEEVSDRPKFLTVNMRQAGALAACIIIAVFGVFAFAGNRKMSVWVNDEMLASQTITLSDANSGVSPASMRAMPVISVPVRLDIRRKTEISVSDGMMQVTDAKTGEVLSVSNEFTAEKDVEIFWEISAFDINTSYEMSISDSKSNYVLALTYDNTANSWIIKLKE